jgi:hypothetical protein
MANVRIQPSRALTVAKSDFADIPYPAIAETGVDDTAPVGNQLIDSTKDFVALNIYAGNIIYNMSTIPPTAATIIANPLPTSPDTLELNAPIFTGAGDSYIIYQSSPQAGGQNTGCVLYVGGTGDLTVTTAGGDVVTFVGVQGGTFLPVQVVKVWNTGASSDILALW